MEWAQIQDMIGHVMTSVENIDDHQLIFTTVDGDKFIFFHAQDCCETVMIHDICGDLNDLVGVPMLMAEKIRSDDSYDKTIESDESFTWTFYKFATIKGNVTVRWYGSSNGYYSEEVDLEFERKTES